ncbi:Alpha/beta knot methyltransferase [Rhodofomes roseus]|uniref:Alpha/beta knot methyltransferase n=1 Tax=Rhodofomes roseus TaxID=34475 RepID=A0ABQ8KW25_9APHY|nr:Alpha/beta knot methyltransferase [Rhodofomes roseus]KAH9843509.1 Alpha/beta knot methyltransferase [Rhodofomes roseus]
MSIDAAAQPRRRRYSGANAVQIIRSPAVSAPPPRPKSTPPAERPRQRRRQVPDAEPDDDEKEHMQIDPDADSDDASESASDSAPGAHHHRQQNSAEPRPTKPLPQKNRSKMASANPAASGQSKNPMYQAANPHMLPVQAHVPKGPNANTQRRLFVILEQACLEAYRVSSNGRGKNGREGEVKYALLNCDDHQGILAKTGRDIADARPDITHQCLLTLLDSPLNKAGLLQVYIHTAKGVLIEVNPHVRIPRTFKRFSGLMVQLLHKLSIRGVNGPEKLLKVIKNPVTDHLPANTMKLTLSGDAPTVRLSRYLPTLPETHNVAVFVGAMARGRDDFADGVVDEKISISDFPLSASVACGKFCCALEELWDIV